MDEIGELHRVLDEEHRDVVADEVPVSFVGIELNSKPPDVPGRVGRAAFTGHRGKAHEHWGPLAHLGENRCPRELRQRLIAFKVAMRPRPARVHDALGDALMIEMRNLFAKNEIFQQ